MKRRTFITAVGTAAIAGCTDEGGDPFEGKEIFNGIEEIGCSAFDDGCAVYISVTQRAVDEALFDEIVYYRDGVELGRKKHSTSTSYRFEERQRRQDEYTFVAVKEGEEVERVELDV